MTTHADRPTPCSTSPACRASTRSGPSTSTPAIDVLLADADAALERAVGRRRCRPTTTRCRACSTSPPSACGRAWGAVGHLNAVADTPELRAAYTENLPRVTEFYTRLGADERLYAKYKAVAPSPRLRGCSPPRRKALDNALRDFVLSGAELHGAARRASPQIQERQAELAQKFSEHVLDATDGYALLRRAPHELDGVPADVRAGARARRPTQADGTAGSQAHPALRRATCR